MKDLSGYMAKEIAKLVKGALKIALKNPRELNFLLHFNHAQRKAAAIRKKSEQKGLHIPPFLIASIASECNLHCAGCYAHANTGCKTTREQLSSERWGSIFKEAQEAGICFILLAGGEPLLRQEVVRLAAEHKNMLFPIFTNGTLFNEEWLAFFDKNRNMLPVLSIEGSQNTTDARRGKGVYQQLQEGMTALSKKNIFYGASVTVTCENIKEVTDNSFVADLAEKGCAVVFYVEYVPADHQSEQLVPTEADRAFLIERVESIRETQPMLAISFPGDEQELGGCLAGGRGFFHISAEGNAEPCPFSPYSDLNLKNCTLLEALESPLFKRLQSSDLLQVTHQGGCVLFENEAAVKEMLG